MTEPDDRRTKALGERLRLYGFWVMAVASVYGIVERSINSSRPQQVEQTRSAPAAQPAALRPTSTLELVQLIRRVFPLRDGVRDACLAAQQCTSASGVSLEIPPSPRDIVPCLQERLPRCRTLLAQLEATAAPAAISKWWPTALIVDAKKNHAIAEITLQGLSELGVPERFRVNDKDFGDAASWLVAKNDAYRERYLKAAAEYADNLGEVKELGDYLTSLGICIDGAWCGLERIAKGGAWVRFEYK